MSFSENPEHRDDLLLEGKMTLDGSGAYESGWIDTDDVLRIRTVVYFLNGGGGTVQIEEAQFDGPGSTDPRVIRAQSITISSSRGYAELDLTCRYFQFKVSGGSANDYVNTTVRKVAP